MDRESTGQYEVVTAGGEKVRAFVPDPLPPHPPMALAGERQRLLESAMVALGRLDALSSLLPDTTLFLYAYVRKEAVLSSRIEGTQSTLADLMLFEMDEAPGVPLDDVTEVSNYVAALEHGLARLRAGFPLSNRLIREIHAVLLSRGRGSGKSPGEFRRSQNWIGGSRPGDATFVPPPPHRVEDCMGQLERFLNDQSAELPLLVRAGLAHVQFETIHPFLDGNGRVGRLLIPFQLCEAGILREPLLYLSHYFKRHQQEYYRQLGAIRIAGNWEGWIDFFLRGLLETAQGAVRTGQALTALFGADREHILGLGRRAGSALRVHEVLQARPLATIPVLCARSGLTFPTVSTALEDLAKIEIIREITGKQRNRVFAYRAYMDLLNDEPAS